MIWNCRMKIKIKGKCIQECHRMKNNQTEQTRLNLRKISNYSKMSKSSVFHAINPNVLSFVQEFVADPTTSDVMKKYWTTTRMLRQTNRLNRLVWLLTNGKKRSKIAKNVLSAYHKTTYISWIVHNAGLRVNTSTKQKSQVKRIRRKLLNSQITIKMKSNLWWSAMWRNVTTTTIFLACTKNSMRISLHTPQVRQCKMCKTLLPRQISSFSGVHLTIARSATGLSRQFLLQKQANVSNVQRLTIKNLNACHRLNLSRSWKMCTYVLNIWIKLAKPRMISKKITNLSKIS